ncbi:MAG TPA: zf-HC2 domain-containing protein [Candidatus Krumholzibacteria bacterium]|nr:zf-HC2 domain-containing protein [Candidatus Krumholzibacteria bacterium]
MPDGRHVDDLLGAYVDAELDAAARAGVETHLRACATCRRDLEALQSLQATLRHLEVPDPGQGYWAQFSPRVLERLGDAATQASDGGPMPLLERLARWFLPQGRLAWPRFAGAFAGVMLVTYIGMRGFRSDEIRIEPAKDRAAREPASAPTALAPTEEPKSAARSAAPPAAPQLEPKRTAPASPEPDRPRIRQGAKVAKETDKAGEGAAATSPPPAQQTFEKQAPDVRPRSETALQDLKKPVPQVAPSPAPSEEAALNLTAPVQTERSLQADASAGPIHTFIAAALAGEVTTAQEARTELAMLADADALDLEHMDAWLRQPLQLRAYGGAATGRKKSQSSAMEATAAAPDYAALDALLWPRRHAQEFRPQVEELARRLVRQTQVTPALRERADAYLTWLVETAPDAATRAEWQMQLDALAR